MINNYVIITEVIQNYFLICRSLSYAKSLAKGHVLSIVSHYEYEPTEDYYEGCYRGSIGCCPLVEY